MAVFFAAKRCLLGRWARLCQLAGLLSLGVAQPVWAEAVDPSVAQANLKQAENVSWEQEWFPLRKGRLFRSMLASPLQVNFSVGLRTGDAVVKANLIDASFGGAFPLFRLRNQSGLELSLATEAGVWFVPWTLPIEDGTRAQEFFSSDFYLGLPVAARYRAWTARVRLYHISFHMGDEATIEHLSDVPRSKTTNVVDIFGAYDYKWGLRLYAGIGGVVRTTGYAPGGPAYLAGGGEKMFAEHAIPGLAIQGSLYVAAFVRSWPLAKESLNGSYALGYMARPHAAQGRTLRAYVEVNHGRSWAGRYSDTRVRTLALRLAFDQ